MGTADMHSKFEERLGWRDSINREPFASFTIDRTLWTFFSVIDLKLSIYISNFTVLKTTKVVVSL